MDRDENLNEFWKLIEKSGFKVPRYLQNILKLRGYEDEKSIRTISDEDIQGFQTYATSKMKNFIPADADLRDYYNDYSTEPESFEIVPGHQQLLKAMVNYVNEKIRSEGSSFFSCDVKPVSKSALRIANFSNQRGKRGTSNLDLLLYNQIQFGKTQNLQNLLNY